LFGSVMRIVLSPRWHRRVVKGSLHSRNETHIGIGPALSQDLFRRGFGVSSRFLFRPIAAFFAVSGP
jgi:hypothetical protein